MGRSKLQKGNAEMEEQTEVKEKKEKFALYITPSVLDLARQWYEKDNCSSMSEYICKAIQHYSGYVANEKNLNYLPGIVISTLKSIIKDSDNRQNRNLFRIAVELSMVMNILAAQEGISEIALERLRGDCIAEVKKLNGVISMDTAVERQNS